MALIILLIVAATVTSVAIIKTRQNVQDLQRKIDHEVEELNNKIQAKSQAREVQLTSVVEAIEAPTVAPTPVPTAIPTTAPTVAQTVSKPPVATPSGSEADAKMWIYMHESGNNPNAVNKSSGACGLAQALPCSKMKCKLGDYACQDAWATAYMKARYGTWLNAKAFWLAHSYW